MTSSNALALGSMMFIFAFRAVGSRRLESGELAAQGWGD